MELNRQVAYYVRSENDRAEYDPDMEGQYDENEGLLVSFAHKVQWIDGRPFQITEAVIEDLQTGEIKHIDYNQLKNFCN